MSEHAAHGRFFDERGVGSVALAGNGPHGEDQRQATDERGLGPRLGLLKGKECVPPTDYDDLQPTTIMLHGQRHRKAAPSSSDHELEKRGWRARSLNLLEPLRLLSAWLAESEVVTAPDASTL